MSRKIKICHFVNQLSNGGVEKVIINYFKNMNLDNFECHIITQGDSDEKCKKEFENLGFTIHTVTRKKESLMKNYNEIKEILKSNHFDIVHSHMSATNFFPMLYSKMYGVKIRISHSHLANAKLSKLEKVLCYFSKILSTDSMACTEDAAEWLFGTKENVVILKNAIDIENFKYDENIRNKIRKELKIKDNEIVIGCVGRLTIQKNYYFLINVLKELINKNKNYKLIIIGIGEQEEELKEYVKKLNLNNNIYFLGTKNNVSDYYQAMDIFALPSLYEGLGIVYVEAQISGLKCIASTFVPKEAKICDNLDFIQLNENEWINKILDLKKYKREDKCKDAKKAGYDIKQEAKKLEEYYLLKKSKEE